MCTIVLSVSINMINVYTHFIFNCSTIRTIPVTAPFYPLRRPEQGVYSILHRYYLPGSYISIDLFNKAKKKNNVEFLLTQLTLFYGPDPTDFIGKFVYTAC